MSQWAEIRHLACVELVPKKVIARRLGVDVKTVRRALQRAMPPSDTGLAGAREPVGPVAGRDRGVVTGGLRR
jgi:hypothetical protein